MLLMWSPCAILSTTSWPFVTWPKIVWWPLSHGVGTCVMKNWLPLVLGPLFAMAKTPGLSKVVGPPFSSSNL